MNGACHCGAVTVEVPGPPEYLNQCNCTLCFKLGTLWGYYPRNALQVSGQVAAYRRADMDPPLLATNFCATCSAVTHWSPTEHLDPAYDRVGVNMRLFDPVELDGIEVRYGDRRVDYDGERRYCRAPTAFGEGSPIQ